MFLVLFLLIPFGRFQFRHRPLARRGRAVAPCRQRFAGPRHGTLVLVHHLPALFFPGGQRRRRGAAKPEVFGAAGVQHLNLDFVAVLLDLVAPLIVVGSVGGGILGKIFDAVAFMFNPGEGHTAIADSRTAGAGQPAAAAVGGLQLQPVHLVTAVDLFEAAHINLLLRV